MRKVYGLLFILVLLLFTSCPSPGFNQTDSKEISGNDYKLVKGVILYSADNIGNYSNSEESNSRAVDSNPTVYDIVNSISSTEEYLSCYQKIMENPVADNSYYLSFSLETQFGKAQFSFDFVNEAGFNDGIPQASVFSLNNASFNIYIGLDNIQFNTISSAASADVYYQDSRLSGNSLKYQLIEGAGYLKFADIYMGLDRITFTEAQKREIREELKNVSSNVYFDGDVVPDDNYGTLTDKGIAAVNDLFSSFSEDLDSGNLSFDSSLLRYVMNTTPDSAFARENNFKLKSDGLEYVISEYDTSDYPIKERRYEITGLAYMDRISLKLESYGCLKQIRAYTSDGKVSYYWPSLDELKLMTSYTSNGDRKPDSALIDKNLKFLIRLLVEKPYGWDQIITQLKEGKSKTFRENDHTYTGSVGFIPEDNEYTLVLTIRDIYGIETNLKVIGSINGDQVSLSSFKVNEENLSMSNFSQELKETIQKAIMSCKGITF